MNLFVELAVDIRSKTPLSHAMLAILSEISRSERFLYPWLERSITTDLINYEPTCELLSISNPCITALDNMKLVKPATFCSAAVGAERAGEAVAICHDNLGSHCVILQKLRCSYRLTVAKELT